VTHLAASNGILQRVASLVRCRQWIVVYLDALAKRSVASLANWQAIDSSDRFAQAL
jgi:hypothetical protein